MSDITLQAIANILEHELKPIREDIKEIKSTLEVHTKALDQLLK